MKSTNLNLNWKTINNYVVLGGSAIIAVSSAFALMKVKSFKEGALPAIFLLTGIAAFNYAIQTKEAGTGAAVSVGS